MKQRRFLLSVLNREWVLQNRNWGMQAMVIMALLLVLHIGWRFLFRMHIQPDAIDFWFGVVLVLGGIVYASQAFQEAHDPRKSSLYYMLPAGNNEKYLAKVLLHGPLFILAVTAIFFVSSLLIWLLSKAAWNDTLPLFNPFNAANRESMLSFYSNVPLFFAGGIFFRRHAFWKTILGTLAFLVLCGIVVSISLIVSGIVFLDVSDFSGVNIQLGSFSQWTRVKAYFELGIFPLFFLAFGRVRLQENEVSYGS